MPFWGKGMCSEANGWMIEKHLFALEMSQLHDSEQSLVAQVPAWLPRRKRDKLTHDFQQQLGDVYSQLPPMTV